VTAAIAGYAWRTPLGSSIEAVLSRLLAGEHAVRPAPHAASAGCRLRCATADGAARSRSDRFLDRLGLLALDAGREAMTNADLGRDDARLERTALFAATGGLRPRWSDMLPALARQRDDGTALWDRGLSRFHPFWMLQHLSNNVHAVLSIELQIRGEGSTFAGPTAGAEALCAAIRALEAGAVDAALLVAYDSLLDPQCSADLTRRGVATPADLQHWRPPYDQGAAGIVPGEASAALVLVRGESGNGRPLLSCAAATDPDPLASGEPRPERLAEVAALVGRDDAIVDGAAYGRSELDAAERSALIGVVPRSAHLVCTAASFGRIGAAGPLVQAIAAVEFLRRRLLPPIAGLHEAAAGALDVVTAATRTDRNSALLLSGGAPGAVAAIRVEVA
jgi:3-oxoacyl-(acyl-carrier-protein) synthase